MVQRDILVLDGFYGRANQLRSQFDKKFSNPRSATADRFVWDYWHVPNQYTLLRTPAEYYFTRSEFKNFESRLVHWGREHLGCHAISRPWLSNYIDGCEQRLHADNPHGPWAFVYSLSRPSGFVGGETQVLRSKVLDYWRNFTGQMGSEEVELVRLIRPTFNRLTVFDPRLPHGVKRVEGTRDPRHGRLVIHGWFVQPQPYFEGGLSRRSMQRSLNEQVGRLTRDLPKDTQLQGYLSLRISIARSGRVCGVGVLVSNLRPHSDQQRQVLRIILKSAMQLQFPKAGSTSKLTLPLIFDL